MLGGCSLPADDAKLLGAVAWRHGFLRSGGFEQVGGREWLAGGAGIVSLGAGAQGGTVPVQLRVAWR